MGSVVSPLTSFPPGGGRGGGDTWGTSLRPGRPRLGSCPARRRCTARGTCARTASSPRGPTATPSKPSTAAAASPSRRGISRSTRRRRAGWRARVVIASRPDPGASRGGPAPERSARSRSHRRIAHLFASARSAAEAKSVASDAHRSAPRWRTRASPAAPYSAASLAHRSAPGGRACENRAASDAYRCASASRAPARIARGKPGRRRGHEVMTEKNT